MSALTDFSTNISHTTELPLLTNAGLALMNLQAKIDALPWSEKLSVTPPIPSRSYPIKEEQSRNWIESHCHEEEKIAARHLIEVTKANEPIGSQGGRTIGGSFRASCNFFGK